MTNWSVLNSYLKPISDGCYPYISSNFDIRYFKSTSPIRWSLFVMAISSIMGCKIYFPKMESQKRMLCRPNSTRVFHKFFDCPFSHFNSFIVNYWFISVESFSHESEFLEVLYIFPKRILWWFLYSTDEQRRKFSSRPD